MRLARLELKDIGPFEDVVFEIPEPKGPGELVLFEGPNGSGKTTIMQAIATVAGQFPDLEGDRDRPNFTGGFGRRRPPGPGEGWRTSNATIAQHPVGIFERRCRAGASAIALLLSGGDSLTWTF